MLPRVTVAQPTRLAISKTADAISKARGCSPRCQFASGIFLMALSSYQSCRHAVTNKVFCHRYFRMHSRSEASRFKILKLIGCRQFSSISSSKVDYDLEMLFHCINILKHHFVATRKSR